MTLGIKPLPWEKASKTHFENGHCHGCEEEIAFVGKWDFYRIYPVSDGKWRWVRQFRGSYIDGNRAGETEPTSAEEAKAAAWRNWAAYLSPFLDATSTDDLLGKATRFEIKPGIEVVHRGDDRWAISDGTAVYNRFEEWEWEPMPSSRDEDFFARARYSRDEAIRIAGTL